MWQRVADFILRFRIPLLLGVIILVGWLGYVGFSQAEFNQEFVSVIPNDDPDMRDFLAFRKQYGEDGGTLLIGLTGDMAYAYQALNDFRAYSQELKADTGVKRVVNITQLYDLRADTVHQRFVAHPVMAAPLHNQTEADSLRHWFLSQPFYRGILYSPDRKMMVFAITFTDVVMRSKIKHKWVTKVQERMDALAARYGFEAHYAGLPYIRTYVTKKLPAELALFSAVALLFTAISLYLFYRSLYSVVFPIILLLISSICTLGIIGLFGYKITILMGMLPPVIIILGIPPSIYMLSDYHEEYVKSGSKLEAIRRMVRKLGLVTFMINANTAFGFLTLYFTGVRMLQEFGIVAFLATMLAYLLTLILIPGIYSLLPPPTDRNVRHLEAPFLNRIVNTIDRWVHTRRRAIYLVTFGLLGIGIGGGLLLQPVAHLVDDIPQRAKVFADYQLMEQEFGGVMPLEIVVDTRQPQGSTKYKWIERTARFQAKLATYPEVARTTSLADVVKWSRQALGRGDTAAYLMPPKDEWDFIQLYANNSKNTSQATDSATTRNLANTAAEESPGVVSGQNAVGSAAPSTAIRLGDSTLGNAQALLQNLTDSTGRQIRITGFVKDVGSLEMPCLLARIQRDLDSIYGIKRVAPVRCGEDSLPAVKDPGNMPSSVLTGTTRIFLKANDYLLDNLFWSLIAVFVIIGLQMLLLFSSWRIMLISMVPNLIPLVLTAGIMGYAGIPLKPSTALIYEMAFGIAIDNSIHYLTMYRYFRKRKEQGVAEAVSSGLRHTGMGIIYTSVVLFMGFIIFVPSSFGSTQSLGILTSVTLFIAMFSNLLLMPALLISFDREGKVTESAMIDDETENGGIPQPLPEIH